MPKYIHTKIRRLDNGAVEVESQLVVSSVETIPAGAGDMPSVIDAAKKDSRDRIFAKLYQQTRNDAIRSHAEVATLLSGLPYGWEFLNARNKTEKAFAPLLNAGKWLEDDAKDSGE